MKNSCNILFAGFGGQGILFAGKFLAYKCLLEGRNVSWLPSYGPEMRGGTANCSVIISDEPIGSPIVNNPDVLVAMNLPSLDKYESSVVSGGAIFTDSSMISRAPARSDVASYRIPATRLADENGMATLANMIIVGQMMKQIAYIGSDGCDAALSKVVSARHRDLLEYNKKALELGRGYSCE